MVDWNIVGIGVGFVFSILALARWFFTQFSSLKTFISDQSDKILNKLEYHERHDDARFSDVSERFTDIRNNIWEIKVQNAQQNAQYKKDSQTKV